MFSFSLFVFYVSAFNSFSLISFGRFRYFVYLCGGLRVSGNAEVRPESVKSGVRQELWRRPLVLFTSGASFDLQLLTATFGLSEWRFCTVYIFKSLALPYYDNHLAKVHNYVVRFIC